MARPSMPKAVRDAVFKEYNHRCAMCGADDPQVHHIDEDHSNNVVDNLIPLCPNCHLSDQHNPTRKIEIAKLRLFRRYKDPAILMPQFHPVFVRQQFLESIDDNEEPIRELERHIQELIEFASEFEMGSFYAKRLKELLEPEHQPVLAFMGVVDTPEHQQQRRQWYRTNRQRLIRNREGVRALLIEQLRFQRWANEARPKTNRSR